jgi:hypothetical protein
MDGGLYKNMHISMYVALVRTTMFICMPYLLGTFINRNTSAEMAPERNIFFYIMRMCCVDLSFNMQWYALIWHRLLSYIYIYIYTYIVIYYNTSCHII